MRRLHGPKVHSITDHLRKKRDYFIRDIKRQVAWRQIFVQGNCNLSDEISSFCDVRGMNKLVTYRHGHQYEYANVEDWHVGWYLTRAMHNE